MLIAVARVGRRARPARSASEKMNAKDVVTFKPDPATGRLEYWGIEFIPL